MDNTLKINQDGSWGIAPEFFDGEDISYTENICSGVYSPEAEIITDGVINNQYYASIDSYTRPPIQLTFRDDFSDKTKWITGNNWGK